MGFEILGGTLIGLAAAFVWLGLGRISGMTGVLSSLFLLSTPGHERRSWALWFLAGLILAFPLYSLVQSAAGLPEAVIQMTDSVPLWLIAGLLVGFGTYIGNGCTSGHGVCGMGRLSIRSIVATVTFMGAGIVTVLVMNLITGGGA